MKKRLLALSTVYMVFIAVPFIYAQPPDTLWTRTYGGPRHDYGFSVQQTSDSGYILTGMTYSYGPGTPSYSNVYLVKTDINGNTLWTAVYGGPYQDGGNCVQQTSDGGYIIAGWIDTSLSYFFDFYLVRTDAYGNMLWANNYGDLGNEVCLSVYQTLDGGYILVGYTWSFGADEDIYLIKTDSMGTVLWTEVYDNDYFDEGSSVQQTSDGGYIIVGSTETINFISDVYLIKTDSIGDTLWTKIYGGSDSDYGYCVQQTRDKGYIITGTTASYGAGSDDVYIIKTDSLGDTLWTKTYGGSEYDGGLSVKQTSDGGYITTGYTRSFGTSFDGYLIRINADGDSLWATTLGGAGGEYFYSGQQTFDGGYVAAGLTTSFGAGGGDFYIIKTEPDVGVEENESSIATNKGITATIFRGPLQLPEGKKCKVFDITGRVVEPDKIQAGIYFIEVDGVVTQKVVKVR